MELIYKNEVYQMDKIQSLFQEWQKMQPLKPVAQKSLDDKFRLEFNYNSNHIEGNTLTYGQTKLLLFFGETSGSGKLRDYEEMKAHNTGLYWIDVMAKDKDHQLTERDIRDLNKIILVEDYWKTNHKDGSRYKINVGVYKTRPNSVITATGEEFHYASPEETPAMMNDFVSWIFREMSEETMSPVEFASLLHYRYIRIHPFEDGNGRIARLLMTYVLKRFDYPMVIIKNEDKDNYLQILHQCDIRVGLTPSDGANAKLEDIAPFVEYMKQQLAWSLDVCIKAAKGENIEEEDDFAKQLELIRRTAVQKNNKPKFSPEEVWDVLEYCFFPITERLIKALKPADAFFSQIMYYNLLFKNDPESKGLHVNDVMRNYADRQTKDYVNYAKSMNFYYEFIGAKNEYIENINFRLKETFRIKFNADEYEVQYGDTIQKFDYQKYPTDSLVEEIIAWYKNSVLTAIERASKK